MTDAERLESLRTKLDKSRMLGDGQGERVKALEAEIARLEADAPQDKR